MKRKASTPKSKKQIDWVAVAGQIRAECNQLTDEEREKLLAEGLKMIYGAHAKTHARGR
jgi:hypothetical protein